MEPASKDPINDVPADETKSQPSDNKNYLVSEHPRFAESADTLKPQISVLGGLGLLVLIFILTRMIIWSGAYAGMNFEARIVFQLTPPIEIHHEKLAQLSDPTTPIGEWRETYYANLKPMTRWDGDHYEDIVVNGYEFQKDGKIGEGYNIAFFPLYPLLVYPVAQWLPIDTALVLVAHIISFIAIAALYLWLRPLTGHPEALTACGALMAFPTSCYLAFAYAECVMLLFIVLTCIALYRGNYWLAAILCGIGTASRPTSVVLAGVVLLHWMLFGRGELKSRLIRTIPLGFLSVTGAMSYAIYLWYRFGSPFVYSQNFRTGWVNDDIRSDWFQYLTGARVWDHTFKFFGRIIKDFPDSMPWAFHANMWNMPTVWFIIFLSIGGMWRVPARFRPLLLIGPLIFLQSYLASGGANFGITPIGRYMAMAAPAFAVLGAWMTREWSAGTRAGLFAIFALLQFSWAFHFGLGEWPG